MIELQRDFDFDLTRCWRILCRFWYIIIGGVLLGAIGGAVYFFVATPLYKSELRFLAWNQTMSDAAREIATAFNQDDGKKTQSVIMYNNLISQSMSVGQALVNDYKQLLETPGVVKTVEALMDKDAGGKSPKYKISIAASRQSCIVTLTAVSPSPKTAARAVNLTMATFQAEQERLMGLKFARIIQSGEVPEMAFTPNLKHALPIGILLGLLVGIGVAVLLDMVDFSVRNPEDIENLDVLVLGEISMRDNLGDNLDLARMDADRHNRLPDEMMLIKTNLRHRNIENPQRTILVTSDGPGCGKSTFAVLLAQTLAGTASQVLLIDGDLRKPSLGNKLKTPATGGGLVDCLLALPEGGKPSDFIVRTPYEHVDFMGYGQQPRRPSDFFESEQFSALLERLKPDYKYIIVDSPPVRGMADSLIIAQKVDGIILIAKHAQTRIDHFKRLLSDWLALKPKILGVVINQKSTKFTSYYGYGTEERHRSA